MPRQAVKRRWPGAVARWRVSEMASATLKIGAFEPRSSVNGPGERAVIWVQGCRRRCPGCFNPQFHPLEGGEEVTVASLADRILAVGGLAGITLSGGEPFEQAAALAQLCSLARPTGLPVLTFTGYTLDELQAAGRSDWKALLVETDLLVAGPYLQHLPSRDALRGSSNQKLHFLTDRMSPESLWPSQRVEVRLDGQKVSVSGFPHARALSALRRRIEGQ